MSRQTRRDFIYSRTNVRSGRILEIGALDSPTFPERNTRYLDWFSKDELVESLTGNENRFLERIVEPEYVVKHKRFAQFVPDTFDVVIASHVIEHLADPLTWLQQIRLVAPSSNLFLAVPDRSYTFDYLRPDSTVAQLLRAQAEDLQQPSRWQLLDSLFYYRPLRAEHVWAGDLSPLKTPRFGISEALRRSLQADQEYVDTHCHVFTAASFGQLIEDLREISGWRCVETSEVPEGENEFYAWLKPVD